MQTQKIDIGEPEFDDAIDRGPFVAVLTWKDKQYKLYAGDNIVGRGKQCDVCIDHNTVSDTHCEIIISNGCAEVKDLRSSNGTFVEKMPPGSRNFSQIRKGQIETLSSGCAIRFGIIHCTFKMQNVVNTGAMVIGSNADEYDIPDSPDAATSLCLDLPGVATSVFDAPTQCMPDSDEERDTPFPPASRLSAIPEGVEGWGCPPCGAGGGRSIVDSPTQIVESDDDAHVPTGHSSVPGAMGSSTCVPVTEAGAYEVEDPEPAPDIVVTDTNVDTDTDATQVSDEEVNGKDGTPPPSPSLSAYVTASAAASDGCATRAIHTSTGYAAELTPVATDAPSEGVNVSIASVHTLVDDDEESDQSQDLMLPPAKDLDMDVIHMILPHTAAADGPVIPLPEVGVNVVCTERDIAHPTTAALSASAASSASASESNTAEQVPEGDSATSLQEAPEPMVDMGEDATYAQPVAPYVSMEQDQLSGVQKEAAKAEGSRGGDGDGGDGDEGVEEEGIDEENTAPQSVSSTLNGRSQSMVEDGVGVGVHAVLASTASASAGSDDGDVPSSSQGDGSPEPKTRRKRQLGENGAPHDAVSRGESSEVAPSQCVTRTPVEGTKRARAGSRRGVSVVAHCADSLVETGDVIGASASVVSSDSPTVEGKGSFPSQVRKTIVLGRKRGGRRAAQGTPAPSPSPVASSASHSSIDKDGCGEGVSPGDTSNDTMTSAPPPNRRAIRSGRPAAAVQSDRKDAATTRSSRGSKKGPTGSTVDDSVDNVPKRVQGGKKRRRSGLPAADGGEMDGGDHDSGEPINVSSAPDDGEEKDSSPVQRKAVRRSRDSSSSAITLGSNPEEGEDPPTISPSADSKSSGKKGKKTGHGITQGKSLECSLPSTPAELLDADGDKKETALRILFSGIDRDEDMERAAREMGAVIVSDLCNTGAAPTHCVTAATLKRTPKLLMAINMGVQYIVTTDWLNDSIKAGGAIPIDVNGGRGSNVKYLVKDTIKEKKWQFSMIQTLKMPRGMANGGRGNLFKGLSFFITKGVCGQGAPPDTEMKGVIESGNGQWLTSLPGASGASIKRKNATGDKSANGLVVISSAAVAAKEVSKAVQKIAATGAGKGIYSIEFVFLAILRQNVNFDAGLLDGFEF